MVIAGPTGSGKSQAALAIARRLDGVIVNADALQVYRDLRILSARPVPAEEAAVPHRLYGFVSATEAWSAAKHLESARAVLDAIWRAGQTPVIVGGTGLYIRALERGLAHVPPIPEHVRRRWREALAARGPAALHAELAERAPHEAARLRPGDSQRLVRALEVLDATGQPLSAFQAQGDANAALAGVETVRLAILPERTALYRAIDDRFERMMADGALDEARAVMSVAPDEALPARRAVGLPPLVAHLEGRLPLADAVEQAKRDSRNYAKRQMTWIRGQMQHFTAVPSAAAAIETLDEGWPDGVPERP
ncbi:MAG: tRNA (adenosine(37)-N6)-dimethylallyltransferase MiaA [Hyphomicrobiales bacterium]